MKLAELRESIESGKTAKLFVAKTHDHGIDLTIRVVKSEEGYTWQRGTVVLPNGSTWPPRTRHIGSWEALLAQAGGMQLRDATWDVCDEQIEKELIEGDPSQLNSSIVAVEEAYQVPVFRDFGGSHG